MNTAMTTVPRSDVSRRGASASVVVPADARRPVVVRARQIARDRDARLRFAHLDELLMPDGPAPALTVVGPTRDGFLGFGRLVAERAHATLQSPVLQVRNGGAGRYLDAILAMDEGSALGDMVAAARFVAPEVPPVVLHAYQNPFESMLHLGGAGPEAVAFHRRQCANASRQHVREQMERWDLGTSPLRLVHGAPRFVLTRVPRGALLVVNRGRSPLKHWLLGSTTRWALEESACDVLVV